MRATALLFDLDEPEAPCLDSSMRSFRCVEIDEALAWADAGGQALHLHRIIPDRDAAPACFVREVDAGRDIAHLFDRDGDRLRRTVRSLGVRVVVVEREGTVSQHVDLCGAPLRKALDLCPPWEPAAPAAEAELAEQLLDGLLAPPAAEDLDAEAPRDAAPLFDPADWLVLPNGNAIPRCELGPCGDCGSTEFAVAWKKGRSQLRTYCVPCEARKRKPAEGEVLVGRVDMREGAYREIRPIPEPEVSAPCR